MDSWSEIQLKKMEAGGNDRLNAFLSQYGIAKETDTVKKYNTNAASVYRDRIQREKEFLTELGTVGHVKHLNVTTLLGCCIDRNLHLVFEFSSVGSVSSNLHDENLPTMAWKLRHMIVVGTARGLHYLYKGCQRRIIHRDIKVSNILLTTNFEPQISDIELAIWLPSEWTHRAIAPIEGTFGCLALEYFMHGIVDEKTDVFTFGVFLLELISGRKPVDGSHKSLLSWAKPYLNDGTIHMLVDPRLGEYYDIGQVKRLTFIAYLCIRAAATWRPFMTEVGKVTSYNYMSLSIILVPVLEYPIFSDEDIERRDFILQANSSPYNEDGSLQVLDKADRLLSMEFEKVIDDILKALSQDRRT